MGGRGGESCEQMVVWEPGRAGAAGVEAGGSRPGRSAEPLAGEGGQGRGPSGQHGPSGRPPGCLLRGGKWVWLRLCSPEIWNPGSDPHPDPGPGAASRLVLKPG